MIFRKTIEGVERPQMEADVTIVGGGPAGMACALRLSQLIDRHNRRHPDAQLSEENVYFLTKEHEYRFPLTPPPLEDHGNYVISINRFVKWLAEKVEQAGITVFTGFAGSELLLEGDSVTGVRTDDKGVDKQNQQKANFEPGYDLKSKVTVLAEGSRGSLTKQLVGRFHLQGEN